MALRFLGEESDLVPRDRVLRSLRILLDEPKLADLVIADLARWQDWTVVDKLAAIFKDATSDNIFVREPIVNYLRACPLPEAAAAVKELEKIDPEACRRAATLAGLAAAIAAPAADAEDDSGAGTPLAEPPAAAGDAALATRIAPVIGDEEPTAEAGGSAKPPPAAPAGDRWKWLFWAAAVAVIALVSRAMLRPGNGGRPVP
jgi:hypothetical protein